MKFRLVLEYDGTDFAGWQSQPDQRTVQDTIEAAVARLLGHRAVVEAAGRTDAGVHASGQVVCFATSRWMSADTVGRALNALTPPDLKIREADVVPDDFDPRRSASSRLYVYRIWNRPSPSPFWRRYAWHVRRPLVADAMAAAAEALVGEHDFSSFRGAGCDARHPVRRVRRSVVEKKGNLLLYEIEATAFLRHMVRNIVGTLVEMGTGRRDSDMTALLAARDRTRAGVTAPALGLSLERVNYCRNGEKV
jgi:tRNA pseudouridine38-40 synthase